MQTDGQLVTACSECDPPPGHRRHRRPLPKPAKVTLQWARPPPYTGDSPNFANRPTNPWDGDSPAAPTGVLGSETVKTDRSRYNPVHLRLELIRGVGSPDLGIVLLFALECSPPQPQNEQGNGRFRFRLQDVAVVTRRRRKFE